MKTSLIFLSVLLGAQCALGDALDTKLSLQWQKYSQAREFLIKTVNDDHRLVNRVEWEALVAPNETKFSDDELRTLQSRQQARMETARLSAEKNSVIQLSKIRELPQALEHFCAQFPKGAMLHVHPMGTMSASTVKDILSRDNQAVPVASLASQLRDQQSTNKYLYPDEIKWLGTIQKDTRFLILPQADQDHYVQFFQLPGGQQPYPRFDAIFDFIEPLIRNNSASNLRQIYEAFAKRAAAAHVSYVELTDDMTLQQVSFYEQLSKEIQKKYGVIVRFNYAFFRDRFSSNQQMTANLALTYAVSPTIVGIDLLGNEARGAALENGQAYYATFLKKSKLHRTLHVGGEPGGDSRNPRDAMIFGAERIGHGTTLIKDPVALEYASLNGVGVEVNLTSNIRLRAVGSIKSHPFLKFLRLGLKVSLSTDDEGIFDIDINKECELAVRETDISYAELKQMALNSIDSSFAAEQTKASLRSRLNDDLKKFEANWNSTN